MDAEPTPPVPGTPQGATPRSTPRPPADRRAEIEAAGRTPPHIVYLDPYRDRPVSPYSPEGQIRMMGDLATGLARRRPLSRTVAIMLVLLVSLPIILSLVAVLAGRM